jgi:hypothetical protein
MISPAPTAMSRGSPEAFTHDRDETGRAPVNVYTCVDHEGHWVGVASVVVAPSEEIARRLLLVELQAHGLSGNKPFTLRQINTVEPRAFVLQDGDY